MLSDAQLNGAKETFKILTTTLKDNPFVPIGIASQTQCLPARPRLGAFETT